MKSVFVPVFCLVLVSCGGGGDSSPPAEPALIGALAPDCAGANCAAVNANTYSGSGIGVWRFNNSSGADVSLNVDIAGVTAGKTATLVFSNGSQALVSAPSSGVLASPVTTEGCAPRRRFLTARRRHRQVMTTRMGKCLKKTVPWLAG